MQHTTHGSPVEAAAAAARASGERYRALCDRTTTWSAGEHRIAIARLLATAQLWRAAGARARQAGDPRADDWDWAAGSVAGLAELHELDDHLDRIAHEIGLSGGAQA